MKDLRDKYKWAIDLIKSNCGEAKVIIQFFDYSHSLVVALEQGERMAGIFLQRPLFEWQGEERKCVGLYQLNDTKKARKSILDWISKFLQ